MGLITHPLARLYLKSQPVIVVVMDSLPVDGVSFLLGNVIYGSGVVPNPIVCSSPLEEDPASKVEKVFPGLFPACAVTCSQAHRLTEEGTDDDPVGVWLEDGGVRYFFLILDMLNEDNVETRSGKKSSLKDKSQGVEITSKSRNLVILW